MCTCVYVRTVFVTGGHTIKRRRRVNEITPVSRFRPSGRNKLEPADSNRSLCNTWWKTEWKKSRNLSRFQTWDTLFKGHEWMKLEEVEEVVVLSKMDRVDTDPQTWNRWVIFFVRKKLKKNCSPFYVPKYENMMIKGRNRSASRSLRSFEGRRYYYSSQNGVVQLTTRKQGCFL